MSGENRPTQRAQGNAPGVSRRLICSDHASLRENLSHLRLHKLFAKKPSNSGSAVDEFNLEQKINNIKKKYNIESSLAQREQ